MKENILRVSMDCKLERTLMCDGIPKPDVGMYPVKMSKLKDLLTGMVVTDIGYFCDEHEYVAGKKFEFVDPANGYKLLLFCYDNKEIYVKKN